MTRPLYDFGLSQEDERTEVAGLDLQPGARVLSLTSGGEMPLSLLVAGAGAVVGVDVVSSQNALARLKLAAALSLPRPVAVGFIGYGERAPADRRADWVLVRSRLPPADVAFWEANAWAIDQGPVWAGRFERYIRWLGRVVWPVLGRWRLRGLFEQPDLAAQAAWFDANIGTRALRGVFRVAFAPRVYGGRGVARRALSAHDAEESLGDRYFGQLRDVCTRTLASDNPLLQIVLLGAVIDADHARAGCPRPGSRCFVVDPSR
jgi:S-adenosylmethionine-diacylglycerol 3-amino-3-carboxypropyl transferase